ncbi:class I SAM-dependent methyltransferase [Nonomuraea sp. SYSU D8015]|uniref:class I SAM-dependent methyltransferase n=1 Tax=Nonomuraea sp. SYSU D8015 TaxID=2593644 RepID=UPI001660D08B|nr:class I SAM-dependent methyltransferase [Nonomuraea sp. SYSU D8015]
MPAITNVTAYWDHYASRRPEAAAPEDALKNAFGWCQYDGHGPGDEILGEPATALELGSSRGHAVAALATKGIDVTGVDLSPVMVASARAQWGHLPKARYVEADALDFLAHAGRRWEAIYSIWGALWFTDPEQWMPLVRKCLTPGGRLVFSWAPPVPGSYGVQGMYGSGFAGPATWIYRWAYEPEVWERKLAASGFGGVRARVEPAPEPGCVGTLIVEAHVQLQFRHGSGRAEQLQAGGNPVDGNAG